MEGSLVECAVSLDLMEKMGLCEEFGLKKPKFVEILRKIKEMRVRKKDMPSIHGRRGDLLVKLKLRVPKRLSRRQKELLREFDKEERNSEVN